MAADQWQLDRIEAQAPTAKAWAEGKKLADGGAYGEIAPHPTYRRAWTAATTGSSGTYTTAIYEQPHGLNFGCTCPSFQHPCKHALGLAYLLATKPELRPEPEAPPPVAPERDALVRACFANPKANLPRLVFADYLDEQGESDWATILRIQCELPPPKKKGDKPTIKRGMSKPLAEARKRLFERFGRSVAHDHGLAFVRGFLSLRCNIWFLQSADKTADLLLRLFREGWVETASIGGFSGQEPAEVMAAVRQVGVIDLSHAWMTDDGLLSIAAELRPGLPDSRVQRLILPKQYRDRFAQLTGAAGGKAKAPPAQRHQTYWNLTPAKWRTVLDAGVLRGVTELHLSGDLGPDGLRRLAESGAMARVRSLHLQDITPTPGDGADGWNALWATPAERLQTLTLSGIPLGDDGVAALCGGSFLPRELLTILSADITAAGASALAACPRLSTINQLTLSDNAIGDAGARTLLASPHLTSVTRFELSNCDVSGGTILAAAFAAPRRRDLSAVIESLGVILRRGERGLALTLHSHSNGRQPLTWPAGTTCPEPLASLEINGGAIRKGELRRLGDWLDGQTPAKLAITGCGLRNGDLPDVLALVGRLKPTTLDLSSNEIGVKGCEAMAECDTLASVQSLHLRGNPIRVSGALALAGSTKFASLKYFHAGQQGYTAAEKKRIEKAFTGVKVKL